MRVVALWPLIVAPSPMKMGEGWDGGAVTASIAPIPALPRCRGKEPIGEHEYKSHLIRSTTLER